MSKKNILVVAKYNQPEALRVAAGLTLLDDTVKVDAVGKLADMPAVAEQLEVLEFADVPLESLDFTSAVGMAGLARDILDADVIVII